MKSGRVVIIVSIISFAIQFEFTLRRLCRKDTATAFAFQSTALRDRPGRSRESFS